MKWVSVKNELPEAMEPVLIFVTHIGAIMATYDSEPSKFVTDTANAESYGTDGLIDLLYIDNKDITHWCEIPENPTL